MIEPYRRIDPRARALVWVLGLAIVACGEGLPPSGGGAAPPTATDASASPAPALLTGAAPTYGPAWQTALASEDPADLVLLADTEGAAMLALGMDHPRFGAVARAALPLAKDAEIALGPLAARVLTGGASATADLDVVLAILARAPKLGERLDPEGERRAATDLLSVARDGTRSPALRAAAVSALRRMAERGLVAPGEIPTDLDD